VGKAISGHYGHQTRSAGRAFHQTPPSPHTPPLISEGRGSSPLGGQAALPGPREHTCSHAEGQPACGHKAGSHPCPLQMPTSGHSAVSQRVPGCSTSYQMSVRRAHSTSWMDSAPGCESRTGRHHGSSGTLGRDTWPCVSLM
jgi:hypothetical protein